MLFSLLLSLTNPADACVAPISVDAVFPASGHMELAPNAIFQLRLSCEELLEDPQFIVEQNGTVIEADVRFHRRNITSDAEEVFVEVYPHEKLKPGASVLLSMDYFGMRTAAGTFVVGEETAPEEIIEVPQFYWVSRYDVSYEEPDECGIEKEGEVYFDLDVSAEGHAIRIYEIDPELKGQDLSVEMLIEPFHTVMTPNSWDDMSALIPAEKLQSEDMCFAATFINEAGVESRPSDVYCMSDVNFEDWVCGTGMGMGCSTMQATDLGWMAMLMGTLGFVRRRKR